METAAPTELTTGKTLALLLGSGIFSPVNGSLWIATLYHYLNGKKLADNTNLGSG